MVEFEKSKAQTYVEFKGWSFRVSDTQVNVEICPFCGKNGYHFYMSRQAANDGQWDCKVCGRAGNLKDIQKELGDLSENIMSSKDWAGQGQPDPLPNIVNAHARLMADSDALDYLVCERGFNIETIDRCKLGLEVDNRGKWLVIPYFINGNYVFAKKRTLPPAEKKFDAPKGRAVPLYNEDALVREMDEVFFVEGEMDTLAMLSHGITNVVGVPGANMHKASWIEKLDAFAPQKIYLLYDTDRVGQQAAREMAGRIGIDKTYNIVLPEFDHPTEDGKKGKDIAEWFKAGHTVEELTELKAEARPFDVQGVQSVGDVLEDMENIIRNRGHLHATFDTTPWPSFTERIKGVEYGDLVGVIAEGKVGKTTFAMNWLEYVNQFYKVPVMMFCQEMQPVRLVKKWVSHVTNTDDDNITLETLALAKQHVRDMPADYLFGYTKVTKSQEVMDTIRQAVRRYGVKWVCFDNLQLLVRSLDHAQQETSRLTKDFKQLAMELNIVIVLIIQPHRVRDGEIVAARNSSGSSAIEKDVDSMVALHRSRKGKIKAEDFEVSGFLEVDENFEPQLLTRVDLNRYGAGGTTTLWMDGAKSSVTEFPDNVAREEMKRAIDGNNIPTEGYVAA